MLTSSFFFADQANRVKFNIYTYMYVICGCNMALERDTYEYVSHVYVLALLVDNILFVVVIVWPHRLVTVVAGVAKRE